MENVRLFVRFRGASDFDQDVKLSGRVCLNLEFFEKIIKFMKKMNDQDHKTPIIGVKIPPEIVKKDPTQVGFIRG